MSDVNVSCPHNLGAAEARKRLGEFEEMMGKYGVKPSWSGNSASLKGTGVSGSIEVTDTQVSIQLKLGMLARAAGVDATKLKGSIEKRLIPALAG